MPRWFDTWSVHVDLGTGAVPAGRAVWDRSLWDRAGWNGGVPSWADVDCDVTSLSTFRGRTYPLEPFGAGTATITVLDRAGRWTLGSDVADPNRYGRPGMPIRVRLRDDVAGVDHVLWRGTVERVDTIIEPGGVTATVDAVDTLGLLGVTQPFPLADLTGQGHPVDYRLRWIAAEIGWPTALELEPSTHRVQATRLDATALDLMLEAVEVDGGDLYADLDGAVVFRTLGWMGRGTGPVWAVGTDPGAICPVLVDPYGPDIAEVTNHVIAGLARIDPDIPDPAPVVERFDWPSISAYRRRSWSNTTYAARDLAHVSELAARRLALTAEPATRVAGVTLDPLADPAALPLIVAADLGTRVDVAYTDPAGWRYETSSHVHGVTHAFTPPASWATTLTLNDIAYGGTT